MPGVELNPHQMFSLQLILSDLKYVSKALGAGGAWGALMHLPYSCLVAYESHRFLDRKTQVPIVEPEWPRERVTAVRNSCKLFDDNKRTPRDILESYGASISASHEAFYPAKRLKVSDLLRTDTSVLCWDEHPVWNSIGFSELAGVNLKSRRKMKKYLYSLGFGVGQFAGQFGISLEDVHGPLPLPVSQLGAHDVSSRALFSRSFAGQGDPTMTTVLFTMANLVSAATRSAGSDCCTWCKLSASKHKFVVAYHAALSLQILFEHPDVSMSPAMRVRLGEVVNGSASRLLTPGCEALRRAFVHYGIEDVPSESPIIVGIDEVLATYMQMPAHEALHEIDDAVSLFDDQFSDWMLTGPNGTPGLRDVLGSPEIRGDSKG